MPLKFVLPTAFFTIAFLVTLQGFGQVVTPIGLPAFKLTYGTHCGFAGTAPSGRSDIETMIEHVDTAGIALWLNDKVPERQAYAIEAISRLVKADNLDAGFHRERINALLEEDPIIQVCRGCLYGDENLKSVIASYLDELR